MTTEIQKPTLKQLLDYIERVDQGDLDLDELYLEVSREALPDKVDDYIELSEILEQREDAARLKAKEYMSKANSLANQRRTVMSRLSYLMQRYHFDKLEGHKYKLSLKRNTVIQVTDGEDAKDYLTTYPDLIRAKTTYEFDKVAIKEYLTQSGEALPFSRIAINPSITARLKT